MKPNQGTPKDLREALAWALRESSGKSTEEVLSIFENRIRERFAQDFAVAQMSAESETVELYIMELWERMFPPKQRNVA